MSNIDEALVLADAMQEGLQDVVDRMIDAPVRTWVRNIAYGGWWGYAEYKDGKEVHLWRELPGPRHEELFDEAKKIVHDREIKILREQLPEEALIEIRDGMFEDVRWSINFRYRWSNKWKLPFPVGVDEGKLRGIVDKKYETPRQ